MEARKSKIFRVIWETWLEPAFQFEGYHAEIVNDADEV